MASSPGRRRRAYHVAARRGRGGAVARSTVEIPVDPKGRKPLPYDRSVTVDDVVHDLRELTG